jgi:hypothetical protein
MVSIRKRATTQVARQNNRGQRPVCPHVSQFPIDAASASLQIPRVGAALRRLSSADQSSISHIRDIPKILSRANPLLSSRPEQPGFFLRAAVGRVGLRSGGTSAQLNRNAWNEPPRRFHALLRSAGFTPPLFKRSDILPAPL